MVSLMTMVLSENITVRLINRLILYVFCGLISLDSSAATKGVAIEPVILTISKSNSANFNLINDTKQRFIVISKVVNANNDDTSSPFVVSMPIQILKEESNLSLKILHLKKDDCAINKNYYLSVTFIPESEKQKEQSFIPVVFTQQVPIEILNNKQNE